MIDAYFRKEDIVLQSSIDLGSMEAIKELVKLGLGIYPFCVDLPQRTGRRLAGDASARATQAPSSVGVLHWRGWRLSLAEETFIGLCEQVAERFG